jgi:hypothetical protein
MRGRFGEDDGGKVMSDTTTNKEKDKAAKLQYPPHPIAELFPILDPTSPEFLALVEDIKENDLREPIMLYDDKVLDGRNRYLALQMSERPIKETHFRNYYGHDPIGFVLSVNLHRRHLNESQRAMIGAKMASLEVGDNQHSLKGVSIETASKLLNVGRASIARARKVLGYGDPETVQLVQAGKLAVSKAAAEKGKDKATQDKTGEGAGLDVAEQEVLDEYDSLEEKLLAKLGDFSAERAEEHSDITINKIKKQVGIMKKRSAVDGGDRDQAVKAAKQKAA